MRKGCTDTKAATMIFIRADGDQQRGCRSCCKFFASANQSWRICSRFESFSRFSCLSRDLREPILNAPPFYPLNLQPKKLKHRRRQHNLLYHSLKPINALPLTFSPKPAASNWLSIEIYRNHAYTECTSANSFACRRKTNPTRKFVNRNPRNIRLFARISQTGRIYTVKLALGVIWTIKNSNYILTILNTARKNV